MKKYVIPLLLLSFVLAAGCAKPPTAEMEAAEAALTRAENDADAAAYGESSLLRARDAANRMRTEARAKRYDAAKTAAAEVIAASDRAIADGRAASTRAREEASALAASLRSTLTETENSLNGAKTVPNIQLDFTALTREFDGVRTQVEQTEAAVNANRPREALEQGYAARSALGNLQTRISDGIRAASRKQ
ncbi:MAG: hypothetical protein LBQ35_04940 [Spirochaetaceae bacterium]|jgi:hypothetical protein|nr:hypothetical protein [Spirochaetaceae bacterium]